MSSSSPLQQELRQTRPFATREQEAVLSIARTAAILEHALAEVLRPFDLTPTQYNVLRILRGAGEPGLCRYEVRERLVAQVPDVTRLLDRLEDAGLVARARGDVDRRVVTTRITEAGLALLDRLDAPIVAYHEAQLGHMGAEKLEALTALLAEVRRSRGGMSCDGEHTEPK